MIPSTKVAMLLASLVALAVASSPRAEEPVAGVLTRAPAVIGAAAPAYPEQAKAEGRSGEVVLELDVSAEGNVLDARILLPAGNGFDEAALEAARRLRFSPAEVDGKASAVTLEYRFRFDAPPPPAPAPPAAVLRGVILERGTREPLAGTSVTVGARSVFTDRDGRFELTELAPGKVEVIALDSHHRRFATEETLEEGRALEVRYYLLRTSTDAFEAVVVGEREKKEVTSVALTSGEVARIAGVSGDTVRVVQNLPGVARAPGGLGLMVVRGGNPADTRFYVDGVEVPVIFHFGGLTSVVPSDLIEAVDFEAGNFGVRHGRATGGRVDLRTRDPGNRRLHLLTDANLFHALAMAEGPVGENVSLALAVRRSYADAVVRGIARSSDQFGVAIAPRYYDLQGKLTWKPTPDDAVRLSFLGSDDRMALTGVKTGGLEDFDRLEIGTGFWQATASWDHRFSDATRGRIQLAQGNVEVSNRFGTLGSEKDSIPVTSLRAAVSQALARALTVAAGLDGRAVPRSSVVIEFPEIPPPNQLPAPDAPKIRYRKSLVIAEGGAWVEATWKPVDGLTVVPGLRVEREELVNSMSWLDPRLAVRWAVGPDTTLKGGLGLYHQPPQIVYVTKEWGNPDLHQEGAVHSMVGVERKLWGPLSLDLQLYEKELFDLTLPTTAVVHRDGVDVPLRYSNGGTGRSYGAELLVRWAPGGRFFGWLSYSLSRSVRDQKVVGGTLETGGETFDQPHNLVALGTVELPELWTGLSAGFRARYSTGNPYRRPVGAVYDADADSYQPVFDGAGTRRTPAFFQLDLRVDKRWTMQSWILSAYLEVQNATNRKNPEGAAYNYDYSQQGWMTGLPLFPSFGLRAEY
jgi:TonB family protein